MDSCFGAKQYKNCQGVELGNEEWRFGLGGREGFEYRHFLEALAIEHKHVQIEGNRCGESADARSSLEERAKSSKWTCRQKPAT
jgi:hypothetical protein